MSCYMIYYKGGAKMMNPVLSREEYLAIRNGGKQRDRIKRIRAGEEALKTKLVQMNYSCLPNEDGTLKGTTRMSTTVGMDVDHIKPEEMQAVRDRILQKKDELGLLMLEESARGAGYHLVFKRRADLDQEGNLKWASELLGVEFDKGAKDITRVFFTTTAAQLLFLSPLLFEQEEAKSEELRVKSEEISIVNSQLSIPPSTLEGTGESPFPTHYHGIPFTDIIRKYWEVNNRGFEPTQGDRDTLTYQLACDLRHICGRNFEWLDQVIPCYDGFPIEEKRAKIKSALSSEYNGFPMRLRNVLSACASAMDNGKLIMDNEENAADEEQLSIVNYQLSIKRMPQGIRESIEAVGPQLTMPVVTAIEVNPKA